MCGVCTHAAPVVFTTLVCTQLKNRELMAAFDNWFDVVAGIVARRREATALLTDWLESARAKWVV